MGSGSGFSLEPPGRQRILASKNGISCFVASSFALVEMNQAAARCSHLSVADIDHENDQADRAISTGKLSTLLHLHTRPINVVVFHGSQGISRFEVGFPLRCIQRLSRPYIATLHCGWRHNRSTRGTSTPVLSY